MSNGIKGFTLIEFMIAAAVAVVLFAIALPSFRSTILNNQITAQTNMLIADIQLARSEALKRGVAVIVCPSSNPSAATPSCSDDNWSSGWLVFASGDTNTSYDAASDVLVRAVAAMSDRVQVHTNTTGADNIRFNPDASTNEGGNTVRLALCDDRGAAYGKQVEVAPAGRPRLAASVSDCTTPT
jgi:type IV fimbrial biogenesis protein FimT